MANGMKKTGQWNTALRLTSGMKNDFDRARITSLKRVALKAEAEAKKHLSRQDLNWKPLDPQYKARKKKQGYSTNILIRTSSYFQAITSWVSGNRAFAGVKRIVKNEDGEEIANLARIQEYGSMIRNIPARPLWLPVFKTVSKWWKGEGSVLHRYREILAKKYGI